MDEVCSALERWIADKALIAERLDLAEHGGTFAPHDEVMDRLEAKVKAKSPDA